MDALRYVVALLLIIITVSWLLMWFLVHPLINFWRALGPRLSYLIISLVMVAATVATFHFRAPLLSIDFGTNYALALLCLPLYGTAIYIVLQSRKHLKRSTLIGMPELAPSQYSGELLTEGIYSRMRHPNYVAVTLGLLGWSFFVNFLAVYLLVVVTVLGVALIARFEERELHARFGEAYSRYRQRVPRFVPWRIFQPRRRAIA